MNPSRLAEFLSSMPEPPDVVADHLEYRTAETGVHTAVAVRLHPDCTADLYVTHPTLGLGRMDGVRWSASPAVGRWYRPFWQGEDDPATCVAALRAWARSREDLIRFPDSDELRLHDRGNGHLTIDDRAGSYIRHVFCWDGPEFDAVCAAMQDANGAVAARRNAPIPTPMSDAHVVPGSLMTTFSVSDILPRDPTADEEALATWVAGVMDELRVADRPVAGIEKVLHALANPHGPEPQAHATSASTPEGSRLAGGLPTRPGQYLVLVPGESLSWGIWNVFDREGDLVAQDSDRYYDVDPVPVAQAPVTWILELPEPPDTMGVSNSVEADECPRR